MARTYRWIALAALLGWSVAAPLSAQVTLSPSEMRELAAQAVAQGQPQLAYDLSGALLQRDATDLNALLIRSRAARDLGFDKTALSAARSAWKNADTEEGRYAASLANAQALSTAGRHTRAQFWLRRAAQIAPNDRSKLRAAEDFRYVRALNRWSTGLTFSISPSSNINNGSRNESSELFGLPFEFQLEGESRALSGLEISSGFNTRYRIVGNDRKQTDLLFGASHRTYVLSDDAKEVAPDADGADFATSSAYVGLRESYALPGEKSQLGWNVRFGQTWYSGDPLLRYTRVGATYRGAVGKRGLANLSLSREAQEGLEGRKDATIWTARLGYGMALKNGNRLSLSTHISESQSDADYLDYTQRGVAVSYGLAKPVGPAQLAFGLSWSDKRHDVSNLTSDGRQERKLKASVTATLPKMDYYGFVPTVTFNAERTDANLDLYETENYGLQLGIRSAF